MDNFRNKEGHFFQYVALFIGVLFSISSGMHNGWPSSFLPTLLSENSTILMTNDEGSWLAVASPLGSILGSILAALTVNLVGRKTVLLMSCLPNIIAWILIAFSKSSVVLILARVISGVSDGLMFSSIAMYFGEIASPTIRGLLSTSITTMWIFGMLLSAILGSYLSMKVSALVSLVLPAVCFFTFIWLPESPYYMVMKGNVEKARINLEKFTSRSDVSEDLKRINSAIKEQQENYFSLFTIRSNRIGLGIGILLRLAQQLSGTTAFTFYAKIIFENAGSSGAISTNEASMIYFAFKTMFSFICLVFVDRIGRRPLLIVSIIGTSFALLAEGSFFYVVEIEEVNIGSLGWIPLVSLILFEVFFSVGLHAVPFLIISEVFPISIKAFGIPTTDIFYCIMSVGITKFFQTTKDAFGLYVSFFTFFACNLLGLVPIFLFVPETKSKTLEDIQEKIKKQKEDK